MTPADRVRSIFNAFLEGNAGVAERLTQGDTLTRHAAFADVRNHVLRKYPRDDMDWYTWQTTIPEIVRLVEQYAKERVRELPK